MERTQLSEQVRVRLTEDLANGKTIVLSKHELDDPSLRQQLPKLLEDLSKATPPDQSGGPRVPGYSMLGEIGQGGMSTVYLARQNNLGRHVAIKIAPKWLGGGDRARRMLVQEAHAMARLSHPNIVIIHDIIDVDDTFAIAMEWVDGRTLASLLRTLPEQPSDDDMALLKAALGTATDADDNFESTPQRHFVRLIRDIARATQTVHDTGLLHLDIKPSNVLVRRDGTPLLADFGVTRDTTIEWDETRTFAGTPVYAAPEQLRRDDKAIGAHTDVYSLGITLYEALARSQPLQGKDLTSIVHCIESGAMPRLSTKVEVAPDLENIVHKAIAPEPEHRYRSATEFADDLEAFLEHRPVMARPLRPTQRLRRWARNEPWKAGLAVTVAIVLPLLAALGSYLATQWPNIHDANMQADLARASNIKQAVYQRWFLNELQTAPALKQLEQAIQIDPGDSSLACLLALANEEGWQEAEQAIHTHVSPDKTSLGLDLFQTKVRERRSFFSDTEVAQLRQSESLGDLYLLALDRVFRAHDDSLETSAKQAQDRLEAVSLRAPEDPLLLGLICWFAVRAKDLDGYESSQRTMWQRWSQEPMVLAWAPLAIERHDPERAKALGREIIKMLPNHPRGYELLAHAQTRTKEVKAALQTLASAKDAAVSPPTSDHLYLLARTMSGDPDDSRKRLEQVRRDGNSIGEMETLKSLDQKALRALIEQIAERPASSPRVLKAAYANAFADGTLPPDVDELCNRVWKCYESLYPDRQAGKLMRLYQLYHAKDYAGAAALVTGYTPSEAEIDIAAPWAVRALIRLRMWSEVVRIAERWQALGKNRYEACFYAGVGHSRLGQYEDASERLNRSLNAAVAGKSWYVQALLEDAYIRCFPGSPKELQNSGRAQSRLDEFEKLNPRLGKNGHKGTWVNLIRGEIMLANGNIDEAIRIFEEALNSRPIELDLAPQNFRQLLQDALKRARDAETETRGK